MIQQQFNMVLSIYAWMLTTLVETREKEAAQELVDAFLRCQMNPVLAGLVRKSWISRKKIEGENFGVHRSLIVGVYGVREETLGHDHPRRLQQHH